jgi:hypothetical protein
MARIFISYRRKDGSGSAGRLHDRLRERYGRDNVFMDVDSIEPGLDFIEVIERTVGSCDVLIALIGRQWLTITEADGQRRIDDPQDFVRHEVATALKRNIRVIPALIQNARMPRAEELPEVLKPLTRRNALELSDTHFHRDVDSLIETLDRVLGARPSSTNPGTAESLQASTLGQWRKPWVWALGGGCLIFSFAFLLMYWTTGNPQEEPLFISLALIFYLAALHYRCGFSGGVPQLP